MGKSHISSAAIPSGVARVVVVLMQRAMSERSQLIAAGTSKQTSVWMQPDGTLIHKPFKGRRRTKPTELLVHDPRFDNWGVARLGFVPRLILWIIEGNYSGLIDEMTLEELADAYASKFFSKIGIRNGQARAKEAIAAKMRARLGKSSSRESVSPITDDQAPGILRN